MNTQMQIVENLWKRFEEYKKHAEQSEFVSLAVYDLKLIPAYNDLHENYNEEHADIFIRCMRELLMSLGIDINGIIKE